MGLFDRLEAGLERAVQGTFAKHLRSAVHPVEIASHIRRAMDDRAVTSSGRAIVPNVFTIELSRSDYDRLHPDLQNVEMDLVAAECLRQGVWVGLSAPELAACASALVFEARSAEDAAPPKLPGGRVGEVLAETVRLWGELSELESQEKVSFLREPDLGFAHAAFRWASGHRLESVLRDVDLAAGDFVRWCKQLADLLGQVADAAGSHQTPEGNALARTAHEAVDAVKRGVVAFSSV